MEKVSFYNIKSRNPELLKDNTFQCVVLNGKKLEEYKKLYKTFEVENQKEYYYPIDGCYGNEVFIYGIGSFKTKKIITIPMFDGTIEGWNDYVLKYGYACLFYSLTGYDINSMDCCALNMQREFNSVVMSNWGLHKYAKFVEIYNYINQIQMETLSKDSWMVSYFDFTKDYLFRPNFSLGGFLTIEPYCDVIADDEKLEKLYRSKRNRELSIEGKSANEIIDTLDNEITDGVFPISTKERIKYFYGEECMKLYEQLVNDFKD